MFPLIKNRIISKVNQVTKDGRIYIFLTVSGGYFCSLIFILFLISLSYANSLAYFCSFLFLSIVWVSCVVTNFNLHGLEFLRLRSEDVYFESEELNIDLEFKNTGSKPRFDIEASIKDGESEYISEIGEGESASIKVKLKNRGLGVYSIKKADLCTSFPFGIFRSWKPYKVLKDIYVVPNPCFRALPIEPDSSSGDGRQSSKHLNEEFKSHRRYSSEGMGRIDWKIFARRNELLLKEYEGEVSKHYHFSDEALLKIDSEEERLAILTYWVIEAEKQNASYSLKLKESTTTNGSGKSHLYNCLRIIALAGGKR